MKNIFDSVISSIYNKPKPYGHLATELPEFMQKCSKLKGCYIGGCIANPSKKWSTKIYGAAHAHTAGDHKGFICFHTVKDFQKQTTCAHELAHIITEKGHTYNWAKTYVSLIKGTKYERWLTTKWLQAKYSFKTRKKVKALNVPQDTAKQAKP